MRLTGEPWVECHICGFELPQSEAVRHYKSKRWVDRKCADDLGRDDWLAIRRMPVETPTQSPQPVNDQGGTSTAGFGAWPFGLFDFGDPA